MRSPEIADADGSVSFYFFDIDDNLFFLPTKLYLWNAEQKVERAISSGEFARIQNELGRSGIWQAWAVRDETFRDFRDVPDRPVSEQTFVADLEKGVCSEGASLGPSWPLFMHAGEKQRPIAMVTARGHDPATIEFGLKLLVERGLLVAIPPILGIYCVTNPTTRSMLGIVDPAMTVPSIKKLAIKDAVKKALHQYGELPPHRFGMSDDDPNNVVLAISAMRDCKLVYSDKRFFVINTNREEFVKLEIFPMDHPVTAKASGARLLANTPRYDEGSMVDTKQQRAIQGGTTSIYVSDMNVAVKFYSETIGLKMLRRIGDEWAEFDAGGGFKIGLHPSQAELKTSQPAVKGSINVELRATRPLEEVVAELKQRGVSFTSPIANYPNVRLTSFLDQDRNELLLAEVAGKGD